jgi:hypothetical protein
MKHHGLSTAGAEGTPLGAVVLPAASSNSYVPAMHCIAAGSCAEYSDGQSCMTMVVVTAVSAAGAEGTPLGAVVLPAGGAAAPGTHRASGRRTRPTPPGGRR